MRALANATSLPLDRAARVDDPVDGAVDGQRFRARRRLVGRVRRPRVRAFELFHRQALALVEVVEFVLAEHLGERVDVVGGRRRRAPRVVAAVAELDVQVDAREGGAARVDAGAVQVLLHQDLRVVVADLRAHHGDRVAVGRVLRVDELPVGHQRRAGQRVAQQLRADRAVVGDRLRRRACRSSRRAAGARAAARPARARRRR